MKCTRPEGASRPSMTSAVPGLWRGDSDVEALSRTTSACRTRSWRTASIPGIAAISAESAVAWASSGPLNGGASEARTRTSNPERPRRSPNDTTRPCESRSMSNSNAPIAATPKMPSTDRAGWRTNPSHARRDARPTTGGPEPTPAGEEVSTRRSGWQRFQVGLTSRVIARRLPA